MGLGSRLKRCALTGAFQIIKRIINEFNPNLGNVVFSSPDRPREPSTEMRLDEGFPNERIIAINQRIPINKGHFSKVLESLSTRLETLATLLETLRNALKNWKSLIILGIKLIYLEALTILDHCELLDCSLEHLLDWPGHVAFPLLLEARHVRLLGGFFLQLDELLDRLP